MTRPLVSVVMAAVKFDKFFPYALKSIISQTYRPIEIVIVVESDFTKYSKIIAEAIVNEKEITFIGEETQTKGFCYCVNRAIDLASGKYIARMDTDDTSTNDRIQKQINLFTNSNNVTVVGSKAIAINEKGNVIDKFKLAFYETDAQIRKILPYRNPIFHASVMYRKADIQKIGGYKYDFHAQDHELWIRMSLNTNVKFKNINEVLYYYRQHSEQSTNLRNARTGFQDITGFMVKYFLKTGRPAYLIGAILTHPFFRNLKHYFRRLK